MSVYPQVSKLARLSGDQLQFLLATVMRFRYFGTRELWSIPFFTQQGGMSRVDRIRVCPVQALQACAERTSSSGYIHLNPVYSFQHAFMCPQVPDRATSLHFLVGAQTCSRWLCTIMDRVGTHPKYSGSICIARASAPIDRGVPINAVLTTSQWAKWQDFNHF